MSDDDTEVRPTTARGVAGAIVILMVFALIGHNIGWWDLGPILPKISISASEDTTPDPDDNTTPAPLAPKDGGQGGSSAETIWKFLRANGLSREQAAGLMGNFQAESGFRADAVERKTKVGFGFAQWSKNRRKALEQAARDQHVDPANLNFQLKYLFDEMHARKADRPEYRQYGTEWNMILHMTTVVDALVAFHHEFEISYLMKMRNPRQAVIDKRLGFAMDAYNNPNYK